MRRWFDGRRLQAAAFWSRNPKLTRPNSAHSRVACWRRDAPRRFGTRVQGLPQGLDIPNSPRPTCRCRIRRTRQTKLLLPAILRWVWEEHLTGLRVDRLGVYGSFFLSSSPCTQIWTAKTVQGPTLAVSFCLLTRFIIHQFWPLPLRRDAHFARFGRTVGRSLRTCRIHAGLAKLWRALT
jgi:hypothetical protein